MRYKFFNTVIHQGLRGWGGEETWGEGGSQDYVGPVLVYPEGQCDHFCHWIQHYNPNQKVLKKKNIFFASIQLAKVETVAFLHTRSLSKNSSQSATLDKMAIRKVLMVSHPHDMCEVGCPVPPWDAKSGVNAALLQHHFLSPNSETT